MGVEGHGEADNGEAEQPEADVTPAEALKQFRKSLERSMQQWSGGMPADFDPASLMTRCQMNPQKLLEAQWGLWQSQQLLWFDTTAKLISGCDNNEDVVAPDKGDRRFKDNAWDENPFFSYIKQSYLLNARWLEQMLDAADGLDPELRRNIAFYNQQLVDAIAPTNFAMTNPMVLRTTIDTKGQNILDGLGNLLKDVETSNGALKVSQTDLDAFEVGKDIAITPGKVVFQNTLFQLIQYEPATDEVYERPLLVVPPWINKYYILDLKPENSFVKWCVDRGYTVFLMSWVNPDETYRDKTFDDYIRDGILAALDAVEQAIGESAINTVGYCIGGTLLAIVLAYLARRGDQRIKSATFLATQVDFEEAGCLRVFTGSEQLAALEPELERKGYLDGWQMANAFNLLRSNDLIWHFVINNYLMGKTPRAFELLYWNADSTRFPARLLRDYLSKMYQQNALATPGAFEVLGEPIDLGTIKIPTYVQATKEDHISPARSVFKCMQRFSGPRVFALAGSGHIAGVVNPPSSGRYQYWINPGEDPSAPFEDWVKNAEESAGSWWPHWETWLAGNSGKSVTPRRVPDEAVIEPAPGSYVKIKC